MNDEIFDEYCQDQLTQLYENEWKPCSFCNRVLGYFLIVIVRVGSIFRKRRLRNDPRL